MKLYEAVQRKEAKELKGAKEGAQEDKEGNKEDKKYKAVFTPKPIMRDLVKGKEHFEKKLKDLGIDLSKIDGDLKEDIEKIEQGIEKRMKKDGVAKRRADLYEERA